jgi:hypothetical protein
MRYLRRMTKEVTDVFLILDTALQLYLAMDTSKLSIAKTRLHACPCWKHVPSINIT